MLNDFEAFKDKSLGEADGLRSELLHEIQALRQQLAQESNDRANASITTLNALLDESLDMLAATLGDIKSAIDAEKEAVAERVSELAYETKHAIKQLKHRG